MCPVLFSGPEANGYVISCIHAVEWHYPAKQGACCQALSGVWCLWWFPESGVCLVERWSALGQTVLGHPKQWNSVSSA